MVMALFQADLSWAGRSGAEVMRVKQITTWLFSFPPVLAGVVLMSIIVYVSPSNDPYSNLPTKK